MNWFQIICVIIFLFTGCANLNKIKSESLVTVDPDGKILLEKYTEYDEAGREIRSKQSMSKDDYYWDRTQTYNIDGTVNEIKNFEKNGEISQTIKVDYINGKWVKDSTYGSRNNLTDYSIPGSTANSSEIWYRFNEKDELFEKCEDKKDARGRVIERLSYDLKGKIIWKQNNGYDKDSTRKTMFEQTRKGESHKYLYTYDDHGNEITRIYYINGKIEWESLSYYKYNLNGDILIQTSSRKGLKNSSIQYTYRDDNIKLIDSYTVYDSENNVIEKGEYKYKFYR